MRTDVNGDAYWFVMAPGQWDNEQGPKDWWAVANADESIIAYALDEWTAERIKSHLEAVLA